MTGMATDGKEEKVQGVVKVQIVTGAENPSTAMVQPLVPSNRAAVTLDGAPAAAAAAVLAAAAIAASGSDFV